MRTQTRQAGKSDEAGIHSLMTTLDTALNNLYVAATDPSPERKRRGYLAAREAYDAALDSLHGLPLSISQESEVNARLYQIRIRLEHLRQHQWAA